MVLVFRFILFFCAATLCNSSVSGQSLVDSGLSIIQMPISYGPERIRLSIDYLKNRHGITQDHPRINPVFIVVHHTGGGSLKSNFAYFNQTEIESGRTLNRVQSTLNVSAHFLVDRDGKIYQLMDAQLFARHTIGLNYCAIGIENVGGPDRPLTTSQVDANVKLIDYLCSRYPIQFLIGHSEYLHFRNSKWWKENDPAYVTYKSDPGDDFMSNVRSRLKVSGLKRKP